MSTMLNDEPETVPPGWDLRSAAAGAAVMLLGVGATLLGWLASIGIMLGTRSWGPLPLPLEIVPVALGFVVYFAGATVAMKSRAGVVVSLAMGAAVLVFGIALYTVGFTDDSRDPVLFLFWGTFLVGLGVASIGFSLIWPRG